MSTTETILATVAGQPIVDLPEDLYVPPEALKIFLQAFEGPLDFLLYLIRKQNIDLLDIPIASVTEQYLNYIELMKELKIELAGEYLLMAATLAEMKSRLLLPQVSVGEEEDIDPRADLMRRLQEYEAYLKAAQMLDDLPREERDTAAVTPAELPERSAVLQAEVSLDEVLKVFQEVIKRAQLYESHAIMQEPLSVRERMTNVLEKVTAHTHTPFSQLFEVREGRVGVVVTLLALLELLRQSVIELTQARPLAPIYVIKKGEANDT